MKGKLIKDLHNINIYRHPVTRKKLESLKTSEIINIWSQYCKSLDSHEDIGELSTEEA